MTGVTSNAAAEEEVKAVLLLDGQGCSIPAQKPVEGCLVGYKGGLIKLDREPPEKGKVGLHLGKSIRCRQPRGIPEVVRKGVLDHLAVVGIKTRLAGDLPGDRVLDR